MPRSPLSRRRSARPSLALALLALALVPASASAAQFRFFHTPSGNINCLFLKLEGKKSLRCDVYNAINSPPAQPASCEFDYGFSFGLRPSGKARRLCVSDAVNPGRVVPYGSSIKRYGMTCRSRTTGLTCRNRSGHGFKLAREAQRLF